MFWIYLFFHRHFVIRQPQQSGLRFTDTRLRDQRVDYASKVIIFVFNFKPQIKILFFCFKSLGSCDKLYRLVNEQLRFYAISNLVCNGLYITY